MKIKRRHVEKMLLDSKCTLWGRAFDTYSRSGRKRAADWLMSQLEEINAIANEERRSGVQLETEPTPLSSSSDEPVKYLVPEVNKYIPKSYSPPETYADSYGVSMSDEIVTAYNADQVRRHLEDQV